MFLSCLTYKQVENLIQEKINWKHLELIKKEALHGLEKSEQKLFDHLFSTDKKFRNAVLHSRKRNDWHSSLNRLDNLDTEAGWNKVARKIQQNSLQEKKVTTWWPYAAVLVFGLLLSALYFRFGINAVEDVGLQADSRPIHVQPGEDKAVLILGDGEEMVLGKMDSMTINKNSMSIQVHQDKLSFSDGEKENSKIEFNQLITPVGGRYMLELADGTKVWLNADSKIIFPSQFEEGKREVSIRGEVYLEVAKDIERPFLVNVFKENESIPEVSVEVLGTEFNISAYPDQDYIATTLIEGEVKVGTTNQYVKLTPGFQAISNSVDLRIKVKSANIASVIGWKHRMFVFEEEKLEDIMKKIGRWYGVDVSFASSVHQKKFSGQISQDLEISAVLDLLQLTGEVTFILNSANKLTVK